MDRRTRNRICIWVIGVGLINFLSYGISYYYVGGDAVNGDYHNGEYYVRGHFLHGPHGNERAVIPAVWVYSYLHSLTIPLTCGLVIICLFILARPHIIATMKEDGMMSGQTFITICITVSVILTSAITLIFLLDFLREIGVGNIGVPVVIATCALAGIFGYVALRRRILAMRRSPLPLDERPERPDADDDEFPPIQFDVLQRRSR